MEIFDPIEGWKANIKISDEKNHFSSKVDPYDLDIKITPKTETTPTPERPQPQQVDTLLNCESAFCTTHCITIGCTKWCK